MSASPYRLFDSYGYDDQHLFFGREEEVAQMVGDILSARLLVLFAPSGSGKSSLLRAGVHPALEKRGFDAVFARVGEDPIASIRNAIESSSPSSPDRGSMTLVDVLKGRERSLVVFIDQFEELFTHFDQDSETRKKFPKQLAEALFDQSLRVYFVLSLRSEYFVALNEFRDAIPTIFHNNANLELRPFDDESALKAIVGPSKLVESQFRWEAGLPERIVRDLKAVEVNPRRDGILPITLQIVCHTLWNRLPGKQGEITSESYETGSDKTRNHALEIIEHRVLDTLNDIQKNDRRLLCRLLREIITKDGLKRVQPMRQLYDAVGAGGHKRLDTLLDHFERDLLLTKDTSQAEAWVELRHDYLAGRIKLWLEEEESRLDRKRTWSIVKGAIGIFLVSTALAWLWNDYHTYEGLLGKEGRPMEPGDELIVTRSSFLWPREIKTGFTRPLLQISGVDWDSFNVPHPLTDWTVVAIRLAKPIRDRYELATQLDAFATLAENAEGRVSGIASVDAIKRADIAYYMAVDDKVFNFVVYTLDKGNPNSKPSAAYALGNLGASVPGKKVGEVTEALLKSLKNADARIKASVMGALGRLGANVPPERIDEVTSALLVGLKDADTDVKRSAVRALVALGANVARERIDEITTALLVGLKDANTSVKLSAAAALGALGAKVPPERIGEVTTALLVRLKDANTSVRRFAADALGTLGSNFFRERMGEVTTALLVGLKDADSGVKLSAAAGLSVFGAYFPRERIGEVTTALLVGLKDADIGVKYSVANALGIFVASLPRERVSEVIIVLQAALKEADDETKSFAAAKLGELGVRVSGEPLAKVVSALQAEVKNANSMVKVSAVGALGELGAHLSDERMGDIPTALLAALKDTESDVKSAAAGSLGRLGARLPGKRVDEVIAALQAALGEADVKVKVSIVDALGRLGERASAEWIGEVTTTLLTMLREADDHIKISAMHALGRLGANLPGGRMGEVTTALLAGLKDTRLNVKSSAADALSRLGAHVPGERIGEIYTSLLLELKDSEVKVSSASGLVALKDRLSEGQAEKVIFHVAVLLYAAELGKIELRASRIDEQEGLRRSLRRLTAGNSAMPVEKLIEHLEDDDSQKRIAAIHLLARRTIKPEHEKKIRKLRDDSRPWVRMAALESLMEIEREKVTKEREDKAARDKSEQKAQEADIESDFFDFDLE